nr:unnamed protein product [Callosobruchus chinensis]
MDWKEFRHTLEDLRVFHRNLQNDGVPRLFKQLIDIIEFYDELLDAKGQKLLTSYVLQTRLSPGAKVRLKSNYTTNAALIFDINNHFISKKSSQLHNAKQNNNKSIDDFRKSLEELLVSLTISQVKGDNNVVPQKINEKIAVSTFASGLRDQEIRTIVKTRNYEKLMDAIQGAKEKEIKTGPTFFSMRGSREMVRDRGSLRNHSVNSFSISPVVPPRNYLAINPEA